MTHDKYDTIYDKTSRPMRKDGRRKAWELVFGKSQEELALEKKIADNKRASRYSRGKLGQTIKMETELLDNVYTARFIMGGAKPMHALIDTATEVTAVNSLNCTRCSDGDGYENQEAVRSGAAVVFDDIVRVNYGAGTFIGNMAIDQICLTLGECLNDYKFLFVRDYTGMELSKDIDAIFGWARPNQPIQLNPSITPSNDPKFMLQAMQDQQFGTDFTTRFRKGFISWIDVGGFSARQVKGDRVTLNVRSDFFWSMASYGVRYGIDNSNAFKFPFTEQAVFLDG
jgi:hypothetical protein